MFGGKYTVNSKTLALYAFCNGNDDRRIVFHFCFASVGTSGFCYPYKVLNVIGKVYINFITLIAIDNPDLTRGWMDIFNPMRRSQDLASRRDKSNNAKGYDHT